MNYLKIYNTIIDRAKRRTIVDVYTEDHHIIPRCMGGNNAVENLATLTPEEHYLCHLLLVKAYPKNIKLVHAAMMMSKSGSANKRNNNKLYGWLRRKQGKLLKGRISPTKGRRFGPRPKSIKQQISATMKGRASNTKGKILVPRTHIHKQNISIALTGRKLSAKAIRKRTQSRKRNKKLDI